MTALDAGGARGSGKNASLDAALVDRCVDLRRRLHGDPELSGQEWGTRDLVISELKAAGLEPRTFSGCAGVTARVAGRDRARCVALRADMDALPLQEASGLAWASRRPGVMHACGHDGHTGILLGVAKHLFAAGPPPVDVLLLFQPSEESGNGARRMIEEGAFDGVPVEAVFGLHGWPDLPLGKVGIHAGPVMGSVDNFDIVVKGRAGHGAQPQHAKDPIHAASQLVVAMQSLVSRTVDPLVGALLTVGQIQGGTTYNVIPETCTLKGTLRTHDETLRRDLKARLGALVQGLCVGLGLEASLGWRFWSEVEEGVHYAVYRFRDKRSCDAALGSTEFKALVADFNRSWPEGVTRTRDIVTLVEERP